MNHALIAGELFLDVRGSTFSRYPLILLTRFLHVSLQSFLGNSARQIFMNFDLHLGQHLLGQCLGAGLAQKTMELSSTRIILSEMVSRGDAHRCKASFVDTCRES